MFDFGRLRMKTKIVNNHVWDVLDVYAWERSPKKIVGNASHHNGKLGFQFRVRSKESMSTTAQSWFVFWAVFSWPFCKLILRIPRSLDWMGPLRPRRFHKTEVETKVLVNGNGILHLHWSLFVNNRPQCVKSSIFPRFFTISTLVFTLFSLVYICIELWY